LHSTIFVSVLGEELLLNRHEAVADPASSQCRDADGYWKVSVMILLARFLVLCSVGAYQAKEHERKTTQVLRFFLNGLAVF
jgi:hypothetical protein